MAGLALLAWVAGVVTGFTAGGLVHLLLVFALLVTPAGVTAGVVLLVVGRRQGRPR